jgi:hypothetical protein
MCPRFDQIISRSQQTLKNVGAVRGHSVYIGDSPISNGEINKRRGEPLQPRPDISVSEFIFAKVL